MKRKISTLDASDLINLCITAKQKLMAAADNLFDESQYETYARSDILQAMTSIDKIQDFLETEIKGTEANSKYEDF